MPMCLTQTLPPPRMRGRQALAVPHRRRESGQADAVAQTPRTPPRRPLITGKTPQPEREQSYERFRRKELHCLVLSKMGNLAVDLPDADVLFQVSSAFGSRQEEAQRLGRILRPKGDGRAAHFFTFVSRDTREEEFAHHCKLFLTEQGYSYQVVVAGEKP